MLRGGVIALACMAQRNGLSEGGGDDKRGYARRLVALAWGNWSLVIGLVSWRWLFIGTPKPISELILTQKGQKPVLRVGLSACA